MNPQPYFENYKKNGFHFSEKVLTKYCLSLYTKPFLILSGISGTGKTKIAQLFQALEPEETKPQETIQAEDGSNYLILNITDGVLNGDGRGNLKFSNIRTIYESEEIPEIEAKINDLREKGKDDNITEPETFVVETDEGEFKVGIYLQRASSPLLRVRFKSVRGSSEKYDSQDFLKKHFKVKDVLKLEKIGARRLKLVSKNDVPVVKLSEALEAEDSKSIDNKLFISVKSNWTDSTELFGYYSVLEEKYVLTPLLKFLLTARDYPEKPFFLILDEMNLSKVEHYFSDFLSCLESRIMKEDGRIEQEALKLHNYSGYIETSDIYYDLVPEKLNLPLNLYVTGTVNIDETTYAFSPKVLDRANVIEFNEVSVSRYTEPDSEDVFKLKKFPSFGVAKLALSDDYKKTPPKFQDVVKELLDILQPYNLHFGYRVINEMALFVNNSIEHIDDSEPVLLQAIDIQINQKILPKISGSFGKLDEPLRKLIHYMMPSTISSSTDFASINVDTVHQIDDFASSDYPESYKKCCSLYLNAAHNGFTSYLE